MSIILTEAGWMRTAYKLAKRFGGKIITAGRSKHPKIVGLNAAGKQIKMTIPSSPSDNARTAKNVEAQLRRAGFVDRSKAAKVKDALVKNTKVTAIPSRRTANQQTTFKDFTQKFQPNVQGPKKPNLTKGEISKRELEGRMDKGYRQSIKDLPADVKFDLANKVLKDIRKSVTEALTPEEKKNAKLNYQYKDVTNPRRPSDPIKELKHKKKGMA
tara:strand:+ start:2433 stop:3074 length:642 start_codon:yes stop_codon:yes gene_type:complete